MVDMGKGIGFIIHKQGPDVFVDGKNAINSTNSLKMLGKDQHVPFILGRGPNGSQAEEVPLV